MDNIINIDKKNNIWFIISKYDNINELDSNMHRLYKNVLLIDRKNNMSLYCVMIKGKLFILVIHLNKHTGGNIFVNMSKFIKSNVYKVGQTFKTIGKVISNVPNALKGPRKNYPPFFRKFKKQNGNEQIVSIRVCKNPIEKTFDTILNLISLGQFKKNKNKLNYDNMFHLYLLLEFESGALVRLEKNQVMNIGYENNKNIAVCEDVALNHKLVTINSLLDNALSNIGDEFFLYNGQNNNCQIFVRNVLKYSDLLTPFLNKFVMQDTNKIIGQLPALTKKVIKGTTDFAGIMDVLIYGARLPIIMNKRYVKKKLIINKFKNNPKLMHKLLKHSQNRSMKHITTMIYHLKRGKTFRNAHLLALNN